MKHADRIDKREDIRMKQAKKIKMGILGAGRIAGKMADTVQKLNDVEIFAIASRNLEKAEEFAKKHGIQTFYGSYEEMVRDKDIELVYIATPHSEHYKNMILCFNHQKHVLCEKAFTINAIQAREVMALAKEKKCFLMEAMWTRFHPFTKQVKTCLEEGIIGEVKWMEANYGFYSMNTERMYRPELAGGALLDLGIYPLTAVSLLFGDHPVHVDTRGILTELGVDARSQTVLTYADGKMAVVSTSMDSFSDGKIRIHGTKGFAEIDGVANWERMRVYDSKRNQVAVFERLEQISGYEYEVEVACEAIREGKLECAGMPHSQTLYMMEQMDSLRREWGMQYPMETIDIRLN